jgi:hypothetical protein
MPGGAIGKLNPTTQQKIIDALMLCPHYGPAAKYAGVHESTLHEWLARGRRYQHWMETGGDGDMMAEKLWRKASALYDNGAKQSAYAVLAELDTRSDRQPDLPYYELLLAVEEARAKVEIELSGIVRQGAREDPRLALAMLKSAFPSRWTDRRPAEDDEDVIDTDAIVLRKQEEARALLASVRERRNGSSG